MNGLSTDICPGQDLNPWPHAIRVLISFSYRTPACITCIFPHIFQILFFCEICSVISSAFQSHSEFCGKSTYNFSYICLSFVFNTDFAEDWPGRWATESAERLSGQHLPAHHPMLVVQTTGSTDVCRSQGLSARGEEKPGLIVCDFSRRSYLHILGWL